MVKCAAAAETKPAVIESLSAETEAMQKVFAELRAAEFGIPLKKIAVFWSVRLPTKNIVTYLY